MEQTNRWALLVDADNVNHTQLNKFFHEAKKYGHMVCKKAFGTGTVLDSHKWKQQLLLYNIQPCMVTQITKGKNQADHALIIYAVKSICRNLFDGILLLSSDADFSQLVQFMRNENKPIIVMSRESSTPNLYFSSSENFVFEETITEAPELKLPPKPKKLIKRNRIKTTILKKPLIAPEKQKHASQLFDKCFALSYTTNKTQVSAEAIIKSMQTNDTKFNFQSLGYPNLRAFLQSLPKYKIITGSTGNLFLKPKT